MNNLNDTHLNEFLEKLNANDFTPEQREQVHQHLIFCLLGSSSINDREWALARVSELITELAEGRISDGIQ